MEEIVYLSGSLVPVSQAKLSPFEWGFLYGYGLFETMRSYSGRIFLLEKHIARLSSSAQLLGIDTGNAKELENALYDTLQANNLSDARIRLTLAGGEGEPVPNPLAGRVPTTLITARDYKAFSAGVYEKGFRTIVSQIRKNTRSPASSIKSLNYLDSLLAQRAARLVGADQAILLNEQGYLAEGSTSNIFLVAGNTLITPDEDSGILPGITRAAVMALAPGLGMEVIERSIALEELFQADEAFFTNSLMEIMPITDVSGNAIGRGRPGQRTVQLIEAYKENVKKYISTDIRSDYIDL